MYEVKEAPSVIVNEEYIIEPHIFEFLKKISIKIYGDLPITRDLNLYSEYVRVFYAQTTDTLSMALIGIEDSAHLDGWTDVLLPIFYGRAPNQGNVDYPIIFVDGFMSGAYKKEFWFKDQMLFTYEVPFGMRWFGEGAAVSVAYIEYDPEKDELYVPKTT